MSWLLSSRGSVIGKGGNLTARVSSWICSSNNMATDTKSVNLEVSPISCLHDEKVNINVSGLVPGQEVTIKTHMKDVRGTDFVAYAHYRADAGGCVDVSNAESVGGSYSGVFPMGLIGCLKPAPHEYKYTRFFKRDVEKPNIVDFSVYSEHLDDTSLYSENVGNPLASLIHQRHYMAPGVQRIPVRYGKVRGSLFLPPGPGPFPGVVDMFGTAGGLLEYRSAQLASRGLASLALAFFAYEDLPKQLEEFNIDYFREAVDYLLTHDKVCSVGVVGTSKGGDLAIAMSAFIPEIMACVVINGCNSPMMTGFRTSSEYFPPVFINIDNVRMCDKGIITFRNAHPDPRLHPDSVLPIERSNAAFLFLVSVDDQDMPSNLFAQLALQQLKKNNYSNQYEVCSYPGAGHLLEPPYSPHCRAALQMSQMAPIYWGGTDKFHILAQEKAWLKMIHFFKQNLLAEFHTEDYQIKSNL